jgi:septal ring factor EnvC (AmiA/AmiB activator)
MKFIIVPLFFLLLVADRMSLAQSKLSLQEQSEHVDANIARYEAMLKTWDNQTTTSQSSLRNLAIAIENRKRYMLRLKDEISVISQQINDTEKIIEKIEADLQVIEEKYSEIVFIYSRHKGALNEAVYMLSSTSTQQFLTRLDFLNKLSEDYKTKLNMVRKTREQLKAENLRKDNLKSQRQQNQYYYNKEILILQEQEAELRNTQQVLSKKGQEIQQALKLEYKRAADLKRVLDSVQRIPLMPEETELVFDEGNRVAPGSGNTTADKSAIPVPAGKAKMASTFAAGKQNMAWPLETGFVADKFGEKQHIVHSQVKTNNPGISIRTRKNEAIKVVYDGVVQFADRIDDDPNFTVIIRHGEYMSVYAGLKSINIKKGMKVKAQSSIGVVGENMDGYPELNFQIWQNNQSLNPEEWLIPVN